MRAPRTGKEGEVTSPAAVPQVERAQPPGVGREEGGEMGGGGGEVDCYHVHMIM